ncbi:DUF5719 family protein [Nocardioides sp.]|uniref:DUF5719 family protein n=1 Tax=Nocardioides sp. TaxID=35761 RepID=UPI0031FF45B1|nr:hypothetical protein [Nocardioides sp.]
MTEPVTGSAPGRRTAQGRRFAVNLTTVLAVVVPLLTVGALALVHTEQPTPTRHGPVKTALTSSVLVCPTAREGGRTVYATTAQKKASGRVSIDAGATPDRVSLRPGKVSTYESGPGAALIRGAGDLAPGLVAARFTTKPVAAGECSAPVPDQWFTGIGTGARHRSVLELTNPDKGRAIVDVTMYGRLGVVDVPQLRGLSVSGLDTVQVDLAKVIPRRDELAIHVTSTRGRVGASVLDTFDVLGAGGSAADQLLPQTAPSTSNVLMGVPTGAGRQTLALVNSGADEVRAKIRLVTSESVFAPQGFKEVRLAPESVKQVPITAVLADAKGVLGVVVDSSGPVAATLRSFVGGDLSHAVAGAPVSSATTLVVPEGEKSLVLSGARRVGVVTVVARSLNGKLLGSTRTEVNPGRGVLVKVPKGAVLLTVTPERTPIIGAVLVQGQGATVVPLRQLVRSGLIPDIRPGTP